MLLATRPQVNRAVTVNSRLPNCAVNRAFLQPALTDKNNRVKYISKFEYSTVLIVSDLSAEEDIEWKERVCHFDW